MKIEQKQWTSQLGWMPSALGELADRADVVLVFGSRSRLRDATQIAEIQATYPNAQVAGCSTAGEICDMTVADDTLTVTAIAFETSQVHGVALPLPSPEASYETGQKLMAALPQAGLVHVFVLSDGLHANGSQLVQGIVSALPETVSVTGGLSGDGDRFEQTLVLWEGQAREQQVLALGLYGDRLRVGYGSWGGWDPFGPERLVTKSRANVLYHLDGKSALDLYKQYLGDYAEGLPATGLLFPLNVRLKSGDEMGLTRTILAVDEADGSMTFAGDVPEGAMVRLMKANVDRLVDGAIEAAETGQRAIALSGTGVAPTASDGVLCDLAICISCVGRKIVLKQRVEEEVEGVREVLGDRPVIAGFYSYGEIAPFAPGASCALHNQTMTITTLAEV